MWYEKKSSFGKHITKNVRTLMVDAQIQKVKKCLSRSILKLLFIHVSHF